MKRLQPNRPARVGRASWIGFFGFTVLGLAVLLYGAIPSFRGAQQETSRSVVGVSAVRHAPAAQMSPRSDLPLRVGRRPIESIRVGDRVYAANPEIDDAERATWAEPDWSDWWHLSLVMPLPAVEHSSEQTGSDGIADQELPAADDGRNGNEIRLLHIELLRPDSWVRERLDFVIDEPAERQDALASSPDDELQPIVQQELPDSGAAPLVPLSPLRGVYRHLALASVVLNAAGMEVSALTVDLDLPEMGASGIAFVTNIQPCPAIRPKRLEDDGQVVTATFAHPPSHKVLDVTFASDDADESFASSSGSPDDASAPIGVTDNHLFWSVDRQEFTPIGQMEIGERVLTYRGDTKRIAQKLPRPGPEVVYNLEVYGEHVYFVGEEGLLVHNSYLNDQYVYATIRKNALGEADSVAYIGKGTKARADSIVQRVADELYGGDIAKAKENFIFRSTKVGPEFNARGLEQAFVEAFGGPNRSLIGVRNAWQNTTGLWNKVNSVDWNRTTGLPRLRRFKQSYNDLDLYKDTFQKLFKEWDHGY